MPGVYLRNGEASSHRLASAMSGSSTQREARWPRSAPGLFENSCLSFIVAVRDAVGRKRKRWMANYSVKVMRTAFAWGRLHGWCSANPAEGIPALAASGSARQANRAWSAEEFNVVWQRTSSKLR